MTDQLLVPRELLSVIRERLAVLPQENWWVHTAIDELLAQPAASEPKPVDDAEAREALASQLCAKLAHDRGAPISWVEAIEIVATITQMPSEEKTKLLAMDDSADQECAHSYANELGCPECGEEFTHPAPAGVVLPSHKDSDIRSPVYGYAKGWNACLDEVARLNEVKS